MKYSEFIKEVTEKVKEDYDVSQKVTAEYILAIKDTIYNVMEAGDEVKIPGFIKFSVRDVPARTAHNPRTGEPINVPAHKTVKTKILTELKNSVG